MTDRVALSNRELLEIWERGERRPDEDKALIIAAAGYPELDWHTLTRMPIGRRDAMIIRLRGATLGHAVPIAVQCPACQERLEFGTSTDELLSCVAEAPDADEVAFDVDGLHVRARPLDSHDLTTLAPGMTRAEARLRLIDRTLIEARRGEERITATDLPPEVIATLAAKLVGIDTVVDLNFALKCPACPHAWTAVFAITAYFWKEIAMIAQALLQDVHALASAYGWPEADILALSPARRAFYLSRVTA